MRPLYCTERKFDGIKPRLGNRTGDSRRSLKSTKHDRAAVACTVETEVETVSKRYNFNVWHIYGKFMLPAISRTFRQTRGDARIILHAAEYIYNVKLRLQPPPFSTYALPLRTQ